MSRVAALTRPRISAEEIDRRREAVRRANHENLLEGAARHPETDHIFEAFIQGEFDVAELVPRIQAFQASQRR